MVGASCEDIRLRDRVDISGEKIPPRDLGLTTKAINYDDKNGTAMLFAKNLDRHYMRGGELIYHDVKLSGQKGIQLLYATAGNRGRVRVYFGDELICENTVAATPSLTGFTYATLPIKPKRGIRDLRLHIDGVSLLEFKLI